MHSLNLWLKQVCNGCWTSQRPSCSSCRRWLLLTVSRSLVSVDFLQLSVLLRLMLSRKESKVLREFAIYSNSKRPRERDLVSLSFPWQRSFSYTLWWSISWWGALPQAPLSKCPNTVQFSWEGRKKEGEGAQYLVGGFRTGALTDPDRDLDGICLLGYQKGLLP